MLLSNNLPIGRFTQGTQSSAFEGYLSVNGCRSTWLITLSCQGNAKTSKSRSAASSEAQTFLTSALIQRTYVEMLRCHVVEMLRAELRNGRVKVSL